VTAAPRWRHGERVAIGRDGRAVDGTIELASKNGASLMLRFDGLLGGYLGLMPVVWSGSCYRDLVTGADVVVDPLEPRYACPLCGGVTYLPADVAASYCPCCGADVLPKDCPHRDARPARDAR
jgi:hypothetical protein